MNSTRLYKQLAALDKVDVWASADNSPLICCYPSIYQVATNCEIGAQTYLRNIDKLRPASQRVFEDIVPVFLQADRLS